MNEFEGKVVLVTGAGRNIGRAIALSFAQGGAAVAVNTRASREDAENTAGLIRQAGGRADVFMADVSDPAAVQAMVDGIVKQFGRLDVLVLNASVRKEVPFLQMSFEEWRRPLSTTLDGAFHCIKACAPHIIAAGGGSIVTLGGAEEGTVGKVHSSAAKNGLAGMVRALAKELAQYQVRVNVVSPGSINTIRPAHRSERPAVPRHIPMGRYGESEEIAATVRFLCSPGGGFITGQTIYANGGTVLGR